MPYIDDDYIGNAIGDAVRDSLTDSDSAVLDQLILDAQALVEAVLENSGYARSYSSTPQLVKRATLGALLPALYGRKQQEVPPQFLTEVRIFEAIRTGDLPIPGVSPTDADAVGGVSFSNTTDRPQIFGSGFRDEY